MSVFTHITRDELQTLLQRYTVGELVSFKGISAGIENTNYFVITRDLRGENHFVLTVFETIAAEELPYVLDLMAFLANQGMPTARPIPDNTGIYLQRFKNKPTTLVERLQGSTIQHPDARACSEIGSLLGKFHNATRHYPHKRNNPRGLPWLRTLYPKIRAKIPTADLQILNEELNFQANYSNITLPTGIIHADLFCDNALFTGDRLSGIIDLYYACNDNLLYDIAVTVNDWCKDSVLGLDAEKTLAFLHAYHQEHPLLPTEKTLWPVMLRAAALRFWVSRLHDKLFPRPGELTFIKDPDEFKNILLNRRQKSINKLWI